MMKLEIPNDIFEQMLDQAICRSIFLKEWKMKAHLCENYRKCQ